MDWKFAYLSFQGRLNRARYWIAAIVLGVLYAVISLLDSSVIHSPALMSFSGENGVTVGFGILSVIAWVLLVVMGVALGVKRLHDRDRSGWFYLLLMVPFVNIWIAIEILFLRGTVGPNRFGPDPLNPTAYPMAV